MSIGLFDLDLWYYRGNKFPNLELMKIYNYYYKKNIPVLMMRPDSERTRFERIIYFKEHSDDFVPARETLAGDNIVLFGNGFYGHCQLKNQTILNTPPSYLPYDSYSNKIKMVSSYEILKRNSLIRLSTNDYTDFKEDKKIIYIADSNPCNSEKLIPLIREKKNYSFNFFYNLAIDRPEQFEDLIPYISRLKRRPFICYKVDNNFIVNAIKNNYILQYNLNTYTDNGIYYNIINLILIHKKFNKVAPLVLLDLPLFNELKEWNNSHNLCTFYQYHSKNKSALMLADKMPTNIRLLLKQNPLTYRI